MTEQEWLKVKNKAFPPQAEKAPPYLWTRVLTHLEEEESRRGSLGWWQWRWMGRMTLAISLAAALAVFYLIRQENIAPEAAFEGPTDEQKALQLVRSESMGGPDSAIVLSGFDLNG